MKYRNKLTAALFCISLAISLTVTGSWNIVKAHAEESIDVVMPRVPADKLSEAQALKNLVASRPDAAKQGKEIFLGKARCFTCHGESGQGNGIWAEGFDPRPRDFTNTAWQKARTDGEIFWAISRGTAYGMIAFWNSLTEEERWSLVTYIRELGSNFSQVSMKKN